MPPQNFHPQPRKKCPKLLKNLNCISAYIYCKLKLPMNVQNSEFGERKKEELINDEKSFIEKNRLYLNGTFCFQKFQLPYICDEGISLKF